MNEITKECSKCRETKPLEDFYSNKSRKKGHSCWCKMCERESRRVKNPKIILWTDEMIIDAAKPYTERGQFAIGNKKAYEASTRRGKHFHNDVVCGHMDILLTKWTDEMIIDAAKPYNSVSEFAIGNSKAYEASRNRGKEFHKLVCAHMESIYNFYDDNELRSIAAKYETRSEFKRLDNLAYQTALRRKDKDFYFDICSHMVTGEGAIDHSKPASLYVIKFSLNGEDLVKIGYTQLTSVSERIKSMYVYDHSHEILHAIEVPGSVIIRLENNLHKHFREHKYCGSPIMGNGNSELFYPAILDDIAAVLGVFVADVVSNAPVVGTNNTLTDEFDTKRIAAFEERLLLESEPVFNVIRPNGDVCLVSNLSEFSRINGIAPNHLNCLARGLIRPLVGGYKCSYIEGNNLKIKRRPMFVVRHPDMTEEIVCDMKDFTAKHGITHGAMINVARLKIGKHQGYMCRYATQYEYINRVILK